MKVSPCLPYWRLFFALTVVLIFQCQNSSAQRALGVDVSTYQGSSVNWVSNKNSGVVFAWSRADEGTTISDGTFAGNMNNGKAAGVYMGAYHFALPGVNDPASEASYFWGHAGTYIKADGLTLMPMLDMEVFTNVVSASSYSDWANQWCTNVVGRAAATGVSIKPFIYCSACHLHYFDTSISQWFSDIANYNGESAATGSPWDLGTACAADYLWGTGVWHVWQYNDTASYPGFPAEQPDTDVYNGTVASLALNCVTGGGPAITKLTANTNVPSGSNVTLSVTATSSSGSTIHYQWAFNGTNLASGTSTSYTITNMQMVKAGNYRVTLTDTNPVPTLSAFISVGVYLTPTNGTNLALSPTGLLNWWTFDGNLTDFYGTNDLSARGVLTYTNGMVGPCMQFDGTSTVITTGYADQAVPWTVTLWVNRQNSPQTSAGLFENGTNSIKLEQYSGTHKVGISILSVGDYVFGSGYIVPVGTWTHLAFVGTTAGISFYENGVFQASVTNTFGLPRAYIGGTFYSGSGQYLDQMLGSMDEVMVYNKALTAAQISAIYAAGANGMVKCPQFTSAKMNSSGYFTTSMVGVTGKSISVYTSPDLVNWTLLTALANSSGSSQLTDPSPTNTANLYYRISQKY